ncbi:class I SAM-dependent methyltransferase [Desulfosarcina ovata]|uniref:Methyltransferase type 11 domain-containing protein n=1 Tax=Desulfosarcina ovata subsp. ovata TaxID=2752305 RepID=A0A5K8A8E3_9BACT|nr:class I SAM-dependent methyltransferase [Desulfosarcina ovata]BBO88330.1 hypothetical protein DSCOOX_15100 [Desulfosarcina ovata subsp. ovata]
MRVYLEDRKALAYFGKSATPEFWDAHWDVENLRQRIVSCRTDALFIPLVLKYLPRSSRVLEGGCGLGGIVHALQFQGYRAIGIDFAEKTVARVREAAPELDVRFGDVRALPIDDHQLDGYISGGVIEHFLDGYEDIMREMFRTLRPNGFLFLSFPYMSLLRKMKARLGRYQTDNCVLMKALTDRFYQYALDGRDVARTFEETGFRRIETRSFDGIKGLKDEVNLLRHFLQKIYDGERFQAVRPYLDSVLKQFASHCMMLVFQKTDCS